jgi:hypothetical protein
MRVKVLIFILLIFAAAHFVAGPVLCNLYNKNAGKLIGFPTSVQKVSVDLLNRMITLKDLTVSSGPQKEGDLITVDTAVISFDLIPLLSRKIRIDELSLNGIRVNFRGNQPLLKKLSDTIAAQYAVMQEELQRRHTPNLPRAAASRPFAVQKAAHGHDVIYRIVKVEPTLIFDTVKLTNITVDFGEAEDDPLPPSVTDIDVAVSRISPEMLLLKTDTSFEISGKLKDQAGSHLSFSGTCRDRKNGIAMAAVFRAQNIELPGLWPYLTGIMNDQDLSTLVVSAGVVDLTADVDVEGSETMTRAVVKFSGLNLTSGRGHEHEPLAGKDRKMIIDAINAAGDFSIEFTDVEQWKKAFREVVMKGIRNLIRKAVRERFFGR